jgi:hypothetical protein
MMFFGCVSDVPHDNPLDPQSPKYSSDASIKGRVVLKNYPLTGISGVVVRTESNDYATVTDSLGYFSFNKVPQGNYTLIFSRVRFVADTIRIAVEAGKTSEVAATMNALPTISKMSVLTRRIARYFPSTLYYAAFSATVSDTNGIGDLDSVWLVIDTLQFPMTYSVTAKEFQYTLYTNEIPSNNLQTLIGKPLTIKARDFGSAYGTSSPFYISRIIEEEPKPTYPTSLTTTDTTTLTPECMWNELKASFTFTYTITMMRVDDGGNKTVIWTQTNIPSYLLSYQHSFALPSQGLYAWTIAVVDEFGNYSTSKEATFIAK